MKQLLIFGCGEIGQLAHFYFEKDSEFKVAGFTVDGAYLTQGNFCGRPVIPFEEVEKTFSPSSHEAFVAISYQQLNRLRAQKAGECKAKGYVLASYISTKSTVLSSEPIGENCFLLEGNNVQPFVRIGRNVTLWSGNHIGHHSQIGDNCFITSHVVISGGVCVGDQCFIGVNATLRDHIKVGANSIIGAGSLVMDDVPPESVFRPDSTERSPVPSSRIKRI
jgi:sugar O-acyltransferase (sialic acid O-acetyltransferase NeuD family)